jgi:hypothetical protein
MNVTRYTGKQLKGMTLTDLAGIGEDLGLAFTKNHTKQERARRILSAYADQDLHADPDSPPSSPPHTDRQGPGVPKPDFERLIDTGSLDGDGVDTPTPQRGGARPGAGRPEGMTAEIAAYNQLSRQPHPFVKQAIEKVFDAWAVRADCPEIRLSKDEAVALALPYTHALELSGLGNRIPPWAMVGLSCIWSTAMIVDCKAALARQARQAKRVPSESLN